MRLKEKMRLETVTTQCPLGLGIWDLPESFDMDVHKNYVFLKMTVPITF